ncbi:MAG: hypothetical protein AB7G17_10545 [Phycisphaerales bacterium]
MLASRHALHAICYTCVLAWALAWLFLPGPAMDLLALLALVPALYALLAPRLRFRAPVPTLTYRASLACVLFISAVRIADAISPDGEFIPLLWFITALVAFQFLTPLLAGLFQLSSLLRLNKAARTPRLTIQTYAILALSFVMLIAGVYTWSVSGIVLMPPLILFIILNDLALIRALRRAGATK